VVQHMPTMHEVLGSIPQTHKVKILHYLCLYKIFHFFKM
jgi:hypothetical protein